MELLVCRVTNITATNINIITKINSYINININIDTTLLMMISVKKAIIRVRATRAAMLVIPGR